MFLRGQGACGAVPGSPQLARSIISAMRDQVYRTFLEGGSGEVLADLCVSSCMTVRRSSSVADG